MSAATPVLRVLPSKVRDNLLTWQAEFLIDRQAMRCTDRTLQFYTYTLDHLREFVKTESNLTPPTLRAWLVSMQQRGWSDNTIHMHARAAKTWCRWMQREGYIKDDLFARVPMPRLPQLHLPSLAPEEVKCMVAVAKSDRDKAIILCLLDTGCRAAEFCALTLADVDMKTGTVQIREGKGRKSRITCVGAKARKSLLRYIRTRPEARPSDQLFVTAAGDALNPNSLFLILKRIGAVAGVEHCNPHAFRRTFATWSTDQNMNVFSLQLLMGHADIATTRRYVDQSAAKLAEAHRRYGPVDNYL